MATDWSREEVEATVADYFAMLEAELARTQYDKAEHRRQLPPMLDARSEGSIEFKHQNISAVLIALPQPPWCRTSARTAIATSTTILFSAGA